MTRDPQREPRPEKVEAVKGLVSLLSEARAFYMADFTGITVAGVTELRKSLREQDVGFKVVKNNILKRALAEINKQEVAERISGPNAIMFTRGDEVAPLKVFTELSKEWGAGALKMGVLGDRLLSKEEVERLSELPSSDELRARVVSTMAAPLSGLVRGLNGLLLQLVLTIEALKQRKQEEVS